MVKGSNFYSSTKKLASLAILATGWQGVGGPTHSALKCKNRLFADVMEGLINDVEATGREMPPSLIFIDPFGPAGFPMELMARLADFDRVKVLINLNYLEFVQWILPDPTKHVTANRLYGGPRWKPALNLLGRERSDFLVSEYERALNEVGWRSTSFEMVNAQNQTAYHLVFGTKNFKGLQAMKRAMRAASQTGEFPLHRQNQSVAASVAGVEY